MLNAMRRRFVLLAPLVALASTWTMAQSARAPYTVGWLANGSADDSEPFIKATRQKLRELGYHGAKEIVFEVRYASNRADALPALAAELVALRPNVIVSGATPGTQAARAATSAIPIVMIGVSDPVAAGFVETVARPGGNVTGIANMGFETAGKPIELLREILPGSRRFAVLISGSAATQRVAGEMIEVAGRQGLRLAPLNAKSREDLEVVFAKAKRDKVEGIVIVADSPLIGLRDVIGQVAAKHAIPTIATFSVLVDAGALASVGPNPVNMPRSVARFIDEILRGANPADMPVEQPLEFEIVVNQRTADALGITIPKSVLLRANEVLR
jgi:putative ABC transport system substrate-binding protein